MTERLTGWFILSVTVVCVTYAVVAICIDWRAAISVKMLGVGRACWAVPFVAGAIMAHWYWPAMRDDRYVLLALVGLALYLTMMELESGVLSAWRVQPFAPFLLGMCAGRVLWWQG